MLYFDYLTGEVIYCWQGNVGESGGGFDRRNLEGRHIASLHSHPVGYYSFPSPENFDILENDFEDYEIITSIDAFWIVEFKYVVEKEIRENFQFDLGNEIERIQNYSLLFFETSDEIDYFRELMVGTYLLEEIDNNINGFDLILVKKEITMTINEKDSFKVSKCIGIPMYPEEYHFDMERPKGITDEHIKARKNKVDKFFEKKGFIIPKSY